LKHLSSIASVPIKTPQDYWDELAVRRGTRPLTGPAESNPLWGKTWWQW
jgi:hypothetical protein